MNPLSAVTTTTRAMLANKNTPVTISVDVTNQCNLRCKHCYFFEQDPSSELNEKTLLNCLLKLKSKFPLMHASWIGGEPLLRKDVVEKGMNLFPMYMVVTNGTIRLPNWKNCVFNVSVDGTKKYYQKVRGNNYDLVKKNIDRKDIKVNIVCLLSRLNVDCVTDMLSEWSLTNVNGVFFNFYTPIKGLDRKMWLDWDERDRVIDKLLHLKKRYKGFLLNSERLLKAMKSSSAKKIVNNCSSPRKVYSIDASGKRKLPCVIGPKADCSRCGCLVPYIRTTGHSLDFLRMFTQYL